MNFYLSGYTNKEAKFRDLSSRSSTHGSEQMQNAINHLNQAVALARPGKEELQQKDLSQKGYNKAIDRLRENAYGPKFNTSKLAPKPNNKLPLYLAVAGALAVGIPSAFNDQTSLGSTLKGSLATGASAGAAGLGYNLYKGKQRENMMHTLELLKDYGVLKPETLRKAYPILRDFEE